MHRTTALLLGRGCVTDIQLRNPILNLWLHLVLDSPLEHRTDKEVAIFDLAKEIANDIKVPDAYDTSRGSKVVHISDTNLEKFQRLGMSIRSETKAPFSNE